MRRIKRKIRFENIITAFLFIIGFYFGLAALPEDSEFALNANAAMVASNEKKPFFRDLSYIASNIIPTHPKTYDTSTPDKSDSVPLSDKTYSEPPKASVLENRTGSKIEVTNDSGYAIDTDALLAEPIKLRDGDIKVLIVHTHTSEAYAEQFSETDSYRSENDNTNVIAVGDVIENVLKERNIGVIHDKTYHDYPSYSGAYKRALETINSNLKKYPSVTFVFDIHRDAISDGAGGYMKTLAEINGAKCAQGLIVIGTDAGGLQHPSWRENLKYGLRLQKIMCEKYPSFARPLHLRQERFNGHLREGAMILEIGSNGNTLEEAKTAALYMGDCVASLIDSLENR